MDKVDIENVILDQKIINVVDKICRHLYGDGEIASKMAEIIGIKTEINSSKEFLRSLPTSYMLRLIEALFTDSSYNRMRHDNWNNFGEYIGEWPIELESTLERKGITYDKKSGSFIYKNVPLSLKVELGSKESFIPYEVDDILYQDLISEINKCHNYKLPTATFVLSRKIIENLIIDILKKKFGKNAADLGKYYDTDHSRFHDFSRLIKTLQKEEALYLEHKSVVHKIAMLADELRDNANKSAHSIFPFNSMDDLDKYRIPELVKMLIGLLNRLN